MERCFKKCVCYTEEKGTPCFWYQYCFTEKWALEPFGRNQNNNQEPDVENQIQQDQAMPQNQEASENQRGPRVGALQAPLPQQNIIEVREPTQQNRLEVRLVQVRPPNDENNQSNFRILAQNRNVSVSSENAVYGQAIPIQQTVLNNLPIETIDRPESNLEPQNQIDENIDNQPSLNVQIYQPPINNPDQIVLNADEEQSQNGPVLPPSN